MKKRININKTESAINELKEKYGGRKKFPSIDTTLMAIAHDYGCKTNQLLAVQPSSDSEKVISYQGLFGSINPEGKIPDEWDIFSPAAYLVDLANFTKKQQQYLIAYDSNSSEKAYDVILKRRPDIKDLILNSQNTTEEILKLNIVNEILEKKVSDDVQAQIKEIQSGTMLSEYGINIKDLEELFYIDQTNIEFNLVNESLMSLGKSLATQKQELIDQINKGSTDYNYDISNISPKDLIIILTFLEIEDNNDLNVEDKEKIYKINMLSKMYRQSVQNIIDFIKLQLDKDALFKEDNFYSLAGILAWLQEIVVDLSTVLCILDKNKSVISNTSFNNFWNACKHIQEEYKEDSKNPQLNESIKHELIKLFRVSEKRLQYTIKISNKDLPYDKIPSKFQQLVNLLFQYLSLFKLFNISDAELQILSDHPEFLGCELNLEFMQKLWLYKKMSLEFKDSKNLLLAYLVDDQKQDKDLLEVSAWSEDVFYKIKTLYSLDLESLKDSTTSLFYIVQINYVMNLLNDTPVTLKGLKYVKESNLEDFAKDLISTLQDISSSLSSALPTDQDKAEQTLGVVAEKTRDQYLLALQKDSNDPNSGYKVDDNDNIDNSYDLYGYLLIDPAISSAVKTARISEAIEAFQLYIYRCQNGLEDYYMSSEGLAEWSWMKNYRVWEDNRRIFLYPENYIQPETRKDKTKEFEQLQTALQKSHVTEADIDNSFKQYVDSFSEIVNLTVTGIADKPDTLESNRTQVFVTGRTNSKPYQYYGRYGTYNTKNDDPDDDWKPCYDWKPWVKIDLTINSPILYPVYDDIGRLFIFWVEMSTDKSQADSNGDKSATSKSIIKYSYQNFNNSWVTPHGEDLIDREQISQSYVDSDKTNTLYKLVVVKDYIAGNDINSNKVIIAYYNCKTKISDADDMRAVRNFILYCGNLAYNNTTANKYPDSNLLNKQITEYEKRIQDNITSNLPYQYDVSLFAQSLFANGIDGLLNPDNQLPKEGDGASFFDYEKNFNAEYFWELFYHSPFLIANHYQANQQFELAEKWYQYIFNPLKRFDSSNKLLSCWNFRGLDNITPDKIIQDLTSTEELERYHYDPFDPHAIAEIRLVAYQKSIVIHYIDNILKWADSLFTEDTRESLTEANMLYVLAYDLLGPTPLENSKVVELSDGETLGAIVKDNEDSEMLIYDKNGNYYFQVPDNLQVLQYWDIISNRLYNLRHSLNIKGVYEQLPLFSSPIDPNDLVAMAAQDCGSTDYNSINQPTTLNYRYSYLIEKAKNVTSGVIQFGQSFLSALEKQDAEELSRMNNTYTSIVQNMTIQIKQEQIDAAADNLRSLTSVKEEAQMKFNYYTDLIKPTNALNILATTTEASQVVFSSLAIEPEFDALVLNQLAVEAHFIPTIFGFSDGSFQPGSSLNSEAAVCQSTSSILNQTSGLMSVVASHIRRQQEWIFQKDLAKNELDKLEQDISSARHQLNIAQKDLDILNTQLEQTKNVDNFLKNKFSNEELYQWISSNLSNLYSQYYNLALDLASKAQLAYKNELGISPPCINRSSWNSLYQGLFAGEGLMVQLQQIDNQYIDDNKRMHEFEEIISLENSSAVITNFSDLKDKNKRSVTFDVYKSIRGKIQEYSWLKIKSISITIPGIISPYQSIHATLTSSGEEVRLSHGISDSGLFHMDYNDQRYLPFEYKDLKTACEFTLAFDEDDAEFAKSITDVIVHLDCVAK